jgi:UDP-N-acetylglucosamine 1-carboxyvinyltransferase
MLQAMARFVITGQEELKGEIKVNGAKNAALPLLAATLLTDEEVVLERIPDLRDVASLLNILEGLGAKIERDKDETYRIRAKEINWENLPQDLVGQLRGSVLLMGALLGRNKQVRLPKPGGDMIGSRPVDVHLDAFQQLGVDVRFENDEIILNATKAKPGKVILREFSVTATENILLLAAQMPGKTTIDIAAAEPHVKALGDMLTLMGARVNGAGTHTITIEGSNKLRGCRFQNIDDMIEAGSFILLAAAMNADIRVSPVPVNDLLLFFKKLTDFGVKFTTKNNEVRVRPSKLRCGRVQTLPHPGIATDLQAPFAVVATQAKGSSMIHDPMYEGRFKYVNELLKMGANITVCDPHRIIVEGSTQLRGCQLNSLDIRSGMTLLMAGLTAVGETIIEDAEVIDRGYEHIDERLRSLGAKIKRV